MQAQAQAIQPDLFESVNERPPPKLEPPNIALHPYLDKEVPSVKGSETSKEAAKSQEPTLASKQGQILSLFREVGHHGLTDDEIERAMRWRHQTVSARRRELVLGGLIEASDKKRITSSGRRAQVWVAK